MRRDCWAEQKMADKNITQDDQNSTENATPRVRFQGIVESAADDRQIVDSDDPIRAIPIGPPQRNWNAASRQVWQASRLGAILIFFAIAAGWPVGAYMSHIAQFGQSRGWISTLTSTIEPGVLWFAIFVPITILLFGYLLSQLYKMLNATQSITDAAREFIHPDRSAAYNAQSVGIAVRGQMDALNTGVDGALQRLASVEAMIRNHVEAIETAGEAIESRTTSAVQKVASERSRLIDLTENLNSQADAFAVAIAEKAQASIEAMNSADDLTLKAETHLDDRLSGLEAAAAKALTSFQALSAAIDHADGNLKSSVSAIEASTEQARTATEDASKTSKSIADKIAEDLSAIGTTAVDASSREGAKLIEAAEKALAGVQDKTQTAISGATSDIEKASIAMDQMTRSASETSKAAAEAASQSETAAAALDEKSKLLAQARSALEKENARLENLIEEQRNRADRLADAIATQTERLSKLADAQLKDQETALKLAETATAPPPDTVTPLVLKDQKSAPPAATPSAPKSARPSEKSRKSPKADKESKAKSDVSWREILDATDDAAPIPLTPDTPFSAEKSAPKQPNTANAIKIIRTLQAFTFELETRLYGDPPPALCERFDKGDRNVFANRILRLNEADVKRRIRSESAKDPQFEKGIHNFLQGFERLLEDATTSETADDDLEEYLSSALGRVYLLIGATVGYFA